MLLNSDWFEMPVYAQEVQARFTVANFKFKWKEGSPLQKYDINKCVKEILINFYTIKPNKGYKFFSGNKPFVQIAREFQMKSLYNNQTACPGSHIK